MLGCIIKVCQGTKQRQHHEDTGITIIFFTVIKIIDKRRNISSIIKHKRKSVKLVSPGRRCWRSRACRRFRARQSRGGRRCTACTPPASGSRGRSRCLPHNLNYLTLPSKYFKNKMYCSVLLLLFIDCYINIRAL